MAENVVFHNAESVDNYDNNYDYDPLGSTSAVGYGTKTAWGANIFTATTGETLKAVSFYAPSPNAGYTVNIYVNTTNGPISGTMKASKSGTIANEGYHTVSLDAPVALSSGQKFSIVLSMTSTDSIYPIGIEFPLANYSSKALANAGESYISTSGTSWSDISTLTGFANTNVCLKAFTDNVPAPITMPDLVISTMDVPSKGIIGKTISISTTIQNLGSGDIVKPFEIRYFLSKDKIIGSDTVLGTTVINSFTGTQSAITSSVTIPSTTRAASYYIIAIADYGNTITESNESNNSIISTSTILIARK